MERVLKVPKKNDVVLTKHNHKFQRAVVINAESETTATVDMVDIGTLKCNQVHDISLVLNDIYHSTPIRLT